MDRRVMFANEAVVRGAGPRRNSEGSPNFMTCAGSPRFHRRNVAHTGRERFPSRNEEDESMEEEDEEIEDPASHVFDFEDAEDFDDVVDYRPRGEILRRLDDPQERRVMEKYPSRMSHDLLQNDESPFLTLDSLDEEVDSDESGYVEAPPKSLLSQDDRKDEEENCSSNDHVESRQDQTESLDVLRGSNVEDESQKVKNEDFKETKDGAKKEKEEDEEEEEESGQEEESKDPLLAVENNQRIKEKERERADFIKCPISETIKKLANASLKSSKSLEMTTNSCLKALNNLKTSKSFDGIKAVAEMEVESPSLHQRKQLLAQQGVIV